MALIKFIARSGLVFEKLAETPWQHAKSIVEVDDQVEFGRVDHPFPAASRQVERCREGLEGV